MIVTGLTTIGAPSSRAVEAKAESRGFPIQRPTKRSRTPNTRPACMSHRPIRVGFVVHKMQVAGAEVLVRETINRLGTAIDPTIFCLDAIGPIGEELQNLGVRVICLERKPGRDFSVAWRLAAKASEHRIQVLHAHQYTPFFYAALSKARLLNRVRLILTEHGRHFPDRVSPVRRATNRLFLQRFADAINACSEFSAEALSRVDGFSGHRVEVVANGIDLGRYSVGKDLRPLRQGLGLAVDRQYILCVARFHPVKDHWTLIRSFAEVCKSRSNVDLLLAGDGPLRDDIQSLSQRLGIADRIRFLGIRTDVPDLMSAADVFALTSESEAASLTVIEAMAAAKPIVVTNVGGNPELIRDGIDGLLFPRGDVTAGARALLRVLNDSTFASTLGDSARQRAIQNFDITNTIDRYHAIYRRLMGRGDSL